MIDICCIGHITLDKIITPESEIAMPGGTTYYFSHGISSLLNTESKEDTTPSYKLIASLADSELSAVEEIKAKGIEVEVVKSAKTVQFENIYSANQNERKQRVTAKADSFTIESVKDVEAKYICLGSLLSDDFPLEVVKYLSERGSIVMDAQGYLREVKDEQVHPCEWNNKLEYFKYIDILKVNEEEARILTGKNDLHEALNQLSAWGIKEVLLTLGSEGSMILSGGHLYEVPACKARKVTDATGCGDTFTMGYVYKRVQGSSPDEAAKFASAISAIKLEKHGPFHGTKEDIESVMS